MEVARTLKRLKTFEKKLSDLSVDGLAASPADDLIMNELDLTKICRTMVTKWIVEQRREFAKSEISPLSCSSNPGIR